MADSPAHPSAHHWMPRPFLRRPWPIEAMLRALLSNSGRRAQARTRLGEGVLGAMQLEQARERPIQIQMGPLESKRQRMRQARTNVQAFGVRTARVFRPVGLEPLEMERQRVLATMML